MGIKTDAHKASDAIRQVIEGAVKDKWPEILSVGRLSLESAVWKGMIPYVERWRKVAGGADIPADVLAKAMTASLEELAEMSEEKCPKCGAAWQSTSRSDLTSRELTQWMCGTLRVDESGEMDTGWLCLCNQLAQKDARIRELEAEVERLGLLAVDPWDE